MKACSELLEKKLDGFIIIKEPFGQGKDEFIEVVRKSQEGRQKHIGRNIDKLPAGSCGSRSLISSASTSPFNTSYMNMLRRQKSPAMGHITNEPKVDW